MNVKMSDGGGANHSSTVNEVVNGELSTLGGAPD